MVKKLLLGSPYFIKKNQEITIAVGDNYIENVSAFHMIGPILRVGTTYTIPRMMDWNTMPMMTTTSQPPCPQITTQTTQTTTSPPTDTTHNQQMNNMDPKQGINSLPRMTTRKRPLLPQTPEPQDQRLVTM